MSVSSMSASALTLVPLAKSTFNKINRAPQSGPLAVDATFQFVDVRDLGKIDFIVTNVK